MLDLQSIADKTGLLAEDRLSWSDTLVPLHKRGVSVSWLINFAHEVVRAHIAVVEQYERDKVASIRYDTPWPKPLPSTSGGGATTESLVNEVIRPLTQGLAAPLFVRVPDQYKGEPQVFVSHAWSNNLVYNGLGSSLYALDSPLRSWGPRRFVWIDFACYNQHRVECVADDMKTVIASIGRLGPPWINSVPLTRL